MKRKFNVLGNCIPNRHYMVDINEKLTQIQEMVDEGLYFTINRARQYGKTTTLDLLEVRLNELDYTVAYLSFEGLDDGSFATPRDFCYMFMQKMKKYLRDDIWMDERVDSFNQLSEHIEKLCVDKKIVVFIDEIDKTSNNMVFLYFLGMLRDKYLKRSKFPAFHSVILVGVVDVKNIKVVMEQKGLIVRKENEGSHNSPWNIAAAFKVDMSFSPDEIATMLRQYEEDRHTGMNIVAISQEIYDYTSGYPFLVSRICQCIDEEIDKDWTLVGVQSAVKILLEEKNTLFDDMSKNLENYTDLYDFAYAVLIDGEVRPFTIVDPYVNFGVMFGYFKNNNGQIAISNKIFEIIMANYFIMRNLRTRNQIKSVVKNDIIKDGKFDMQLCLEKFAKHYQEIYNPKEDAVFLERHGRMVFLSYLKPLINGYGFYHIESGLTDYRRMDIVLDYGKEQFIIELKRWSGDSDHSEAYEQLLGYMDSKGATEGYLLTFDFRQYINRESKAQWVKFDGRRIFDVIV